MVQRMLDIRNCRGAVQTYGIGLMLFLVCAGCSGDVRDNAPLVLNLEGDFRALDAADLNGFPTTPESGLTVFVSESLQEPKPVSGAEIDVIGDRVTKQDLVTDKSGVCHFEFPLSGDVAISVNHDYYPSNRGVISLSGPSQLLVVLLDPKSHASGKVYAAETGKPITKFKVRFLGDSSWFSPRWRGKSVEIESEDGTFDSHGVRDAWGVVIRADGFAPLEVWLRQGLRNDEVFLDCPLQRAHILGGTVVNESGEPVAGAEVRPERGLTRGDLHQLTTDANGEFRIADLAEPPGAIILYHENLAPVRVTVPEGIPGEEVLVNAVMNSGVDVVGTVALNGEKVAAALVEVSSAPYALRKTTETGQDGMYQFSHVPFGEYRLSVRLQPGDIRGIPRDAPERMAIRDCLAGDGNRQTREDFNFVQTPAMVEGFVRFDEEPAMAVVSLAYLDGDRYILRTQTDDGGWYQLTGAPEGHFLVSVEGAIPETIREFQDLDGSLNIRYDTMRRHFAVHVPEDGYVQKDFNLRSGGVIRGVVHGIEGSARDVAVRLDFLWPDPGAEPIVRPDFVNVSRDGTFVAAGLPPGAYRLEAVLEVDDSDQNLSQRIDDGRPTRARPLRPTNMRERGVSADVSSRSSSVEVIIEGNDEFNVELNGPALIASIE